MSMEMDMEEVLGPDFIQMPLKEESEGHNNCLLEEVFGPMEDFDDLLTELPLTNDFDGLKVPKKIHKIHFVKFPAYENPNLKIRIEDAEKIVQRENQVRAAIDEKLKEKKLDRDHIIGELRSVTFRDWFSQSMDRIRKDIEHFQQCLEDHHCSKNPNRGKATIKSLCYRIQHGTNSLSEEKKLLGEIEQMEVEKKKAIADTDLKSHIPNYLGTKAAVHDRIEVLSNELDRLKKKDLEIRATKKCLKGELEAAEREIRRLEKKMVEINRKKDEAYRCILELKRQRDEENAFRLQLVSLLNDAKGLAETKDVKALKESSKTQVELFMSRWNGSKAFRDDYENRMVTIKHESKSGERRIRGNRFNAVNSHAGG
ncbi:Proton pump-interactor like [Actinidia chinensis var. chinensis]|uniref:Proton pump-interactor like n=1 Tax=Actinidia chinensis var. chinensis TaxID=1590841 RepID=A0A2R6PEE1_ACTCC|nr:Proton pump-interactor like [Actinidia chinensis var. chinensis]